MEDDLLGDSSNIKKQDSGKLDYSLGIDGVMYPCFVLEPGFSSIGWGVCVF